jgi:hypothetical protein
MARKSTSLRFGRFTLANERIGTWWGEAPAEPRSFLGTALTGSRLVGTMGQLGVDWVLGTGDRLQTSHG